LPSLRLKKIEHFSKVSTYQGHKVEGWDAFVIPSDLSLTGLLFLSLLSLFSKHSLKLVGCGLYLLFGALAGVFQLLFGLLGHGLSVGS